MRSLHCVTCKRPNHDFATEDAPHCIPPASVLQFGPHRLSGAYRAALFERFPQFTAEQIVETYLGQNLLFPSQSNWMQQTSESSAPCSSESSYAESDSSSST